MIIPSYYNLQAPLIIGGVVLKDKHSARRQIAAARAEGREPPPIGKRARLAAKPQAKPVIAMVIGKPKLATQPAVQAPEPAMLGPKPGGANTPIEEMDFPPVVWSRLKTHGINNAGELSAYREKIPLIAAKRRSEIATKLAALGLPCNLPE